MKFARLASYTTELLPTYICGLGVHFYRTPKKNSPACDPQSRLLRALIVPTLTEPHGLPVHDENQVTYLENQKISPGSQFLNSSPSSPTFCQWIADITKHSPNQKESPKNESPDAQKNCPFSDLYDGHVMGKIARLATGTSGRFWISGLITCPMGVLNAGNDPSRMALPADVMRLPKNHPSHPSLNGQISFAITPYRMISHLYSIPHAD
jgi:hypothetical protein